MESKHDYDQPPRLENEDSYEEWKKALSLWSIVTDIPKDKQAIAVALRLNGKARKAALEIKMGDLNSDAGIEILLKKLDVTLVIDPMTIYKVFRDFDSLKKRPFETYKTFVKNFIALYTRLKEVGVVFSERLLTLKFISSAQLSDSQAMDILRRTGDGSLESAIINLLCFVDEPRTSRPLTVAVTTTRTKPTEKSVSGADIFKLSSLSTITTSSASYLSTQQKIQCQKSGSTFKGTLVAEKKPGPWDCPCCNSKNLSNDTKCASCNTSVPATPKTVHGKNRTGSSTSFAFGSKPPELSFGAMTKPGVQKDQTVVKTFEKAGMFNLGTTQAASEKKDLGNKTLGAGCANVAGSSFADIIKSNTKSGFAFGGTNTRSVGMSKQKTSFANLTETETDSTQNEDENYQTKENNDIHFEPIANLPEKVDLVTGEEGEETIYSERCKLYRFNKPTNEWKERGVGDIKLQKSVKTGRIRIVMRREQALKVCANHYIRPGMTLEGSKTSDRAWTWTALDYTEEEPQMEVFTARFKNADVANTFKEKFDMCQMMLLDADPMTSCKASSLKTEELSNKAEKMKNELRYFKDKFSYPSKIDLENTITNAGATETRLQSSVGPLTPLVTQHAKSRKSLEQSRESAINETPRKHTTSSSSDDPQAEADVHFEPVIQIPDKIDLTTGEEDEQVIFRNRGKLFAYHKETKQWKERGVGDVKILQNLTTFKVRVMMRREQVFKVCLNHFLQPEIKLSFKEKNSSKTLLWSAKDFSDTDKPDGEALQFALRFKDPTTSSSFKESWEDGVQAAVSKILLDIDPSLINTSAMRSGATNPGPGAKSPTNLESPVKQAPFSFANVPSPFDVSKTTGPVNVMGFVFGKTPDKSSTPANEKFKFDISNMSFAFGGTSTSQEVQLLRFKTEELCEAFKDKIKEIKEIQNS